MPAITLPIGKLRTDGATQPRAKLNEDVLTEYEENWRARDQFPAVDAVYDGKYYWLWNGFHRVESGRKAGIREIKVNVTQGDLALAQWLSFGANKTHGLRRTTQEKQDAVKNALLHPLAAGKSDRDLAKHIGVSNVMVATWRKELSATVKVLQSTERTGSDGRTIHIAHIAAANQARAQAKPQHPTPSQSSQLPVGAGEPAENENTTEEKSLAVLEKEPEASKDPLGRIIPEDLRPVFDTMRPVLTEMSNLLIRAQTIWTQFEKSLGAVENPRLFAGPGFWDARNQIAQLKFLAYAFRRAAPYTVCVTCKRREKNCPSCNNTGWITQDLYERSDSGIRAEDSPTWREANARDGIKDLSSQGR